MKSITQAPSSTNWQRCAPSSPKAFHRIGSQPRVIRDPRAATVTTASALPQTSSANAKRSSFDPVLGSFVQWAIKSGIEFNGLRPDNTPGGGRGLVSTFPISKNDTLIAIPKSKIIVLVPEEAPISPLISKAAWEQLPWYGKLACKLASLATAGIEGGYSDYAAVLPSEAVDLPVLWEDASSEDGSMRLGVEGLEYPYLEEKVKSERELWESMYSVVAPYVNTLAYRRVPSSRGGDAGEKRGSFSAPVLPQAGPKALYFWALSCVRSRSFGGPHFKTPVKAKLAVFAALQIVAGAGFLGLGDLGHLPPTVWQVLAILLPVAWLASEAKEAQTLVEYVICPFIDFLNHSSKSQSECSFDFIRDSYRVNSDRSYSPGQEVFINYGSQSNDQLMLLYGFCEQSNQYDRYVMPRLRQWLHQGPMSDFEPEALNKWLDRPDVAQLLDEAIIQPGDQGFAPEVIDLLSSYLRPQASAPTHPENLLSLTLADACTRELAAFSTSLEDDRAAISFIEARLRGDPLNPPSEELGPPGATPSSEAEAAPSQIEADLANEEATASGGYAAPGEVEEASPSGAMLEQQDTEGLSEVGVVVAEEGEEVEVVEAPVIRAEAFRKLCILTFRVEKKQILQQCLALYSDQRRGL